MMYFEQVRIPMFNDKGRALDARLWARDLIKLLSSFGIKSKLIMKGLGQATIIIGGK